MDDKIILNKELIRAIGADTRIGILKALKQRQKTQSELANELDMSAPTIIQHIEQLENAGLVERIDEGRKWKYYCLTVKGERLTSGSKVHAIVLLAIGLLVALSSMFLMLDDSGMQGQNIRAYDNLALETDSSMAIAAEANENLEQSASAATAMEAEVPTQALRKDSGSTLSESPSEPVAGQLEEPTNYYAMAFAISVAAIGLSLWMMIRR